MGTEELPQIEQYKRLVFDEWTDEATVAAWRKWHPKATVQLQAMTDALLETARVRPGQRVLDLASGTGQPAIDLVVHFTNSGGEGGQAGIVVAPWALTGGALNWGVR